MSGDLVFRAPLVFMDTETTGLALDDDIWEFAAIRRDPDGAETETHLFIEHDRAKCSRLPQSFLDDHCDRYRDHRAVSRREACSRIADVFRDGRPHVVGAVPNFDTERIAAMVKAEWPGWPTTDEWWHYHLIDVENLVAGFLGGVCRSGGAAADQSCSWLGGPPMPPWDSEALSRAVGVDPDRFERHTAMGDVRWAMTLFDSVMGSAS